MARLTPDLDIRASSHRAALEPTQAGWPRCQANSGQSPPASEGRDPQPRAGDDTASTPTDEQPPRYAAPDFRGHYQRLRDSTSEPIDPRGLDPTPFTLTRIRKQ